jgi:hypothetical protein
VLVHGIFNVSKGLGIRARNYIVLARETMRGQNFEVTVLQQNGEPYAEKRINGAPGFCAEVGLEFKVRVAIHNIALLPPYGSGYYRAFLEVDGADVGYSWCLGGSVHTRTFAGFRENHLDLRTFRFSQPSLSEVTRAAPDLSASRFGVCGWLRGFI